MVPPILFSETRFFQNLKLKSVFLLIFMNFGLVNIPKGSAMTTFSQIALLKPMKIVYNKK